MYVTMIDNVQHVLSFLIFVDVHYNRDHFHLMAIIFLLFLVLLFGVGWWLGLLW